MSLGRARVIKDPRPATSASPSSAVTRVAPAPYDRIPGPFARRIPRETMEARDQAASIVAAARAEAEAIVAEAKRSVAEVTEAAAREAREAAVGRVIAEHVALRLTEEQRAERAIDRTIAIAALLAERIVGEALAIEPARIAALASQALVETRGARQVRIEACAADATVLEELLASIGNGVATIATNDALGRGSLVVHTDLGRVDARLGSQVARLTEALRAALREESRRTAREDATGSGSPNGDASAPGAGNASGGGGRSETG